MNAQRNKLLLNLGKSGKQHDVSASEDLINLTQNMVKSANGKYSDELQLY